MTFVSSLSSGQSCSIPQFLESFRLLEDRLNLEEICLRSQRKITNNLLNVTKLFQNILNLEKNISLFRTISIHIFISSRLALMMVFVAYL